MSKLTKKDVLHVAKLAKLDISETEILPSLITLVNWLKLIPQILNRQVKPQVSPMFLGVMRLKKAVSIRIKPFPVQIKFITATLKFLQFWKGERTNEFTTYNKRNEGRASHKKVFCGGIG
jgi:hypothetical protein